MDFILKLYYNINKLKFIEVISKDEDDVKLKRLWLLLVLYY